MKYPAFAAFVSAASLLINACTTVTPAYKDIGERKAHCVAGGPDEVAQQFYDFYLHHPMEGIPDSQQLAPYRRWLSAPLYADLQRAHQTRNATGLPRGDLFSSSATGASEAHVSSASQIPNTDARNIALRVSLLRGSRPELTWQDEILMVREGTCWTVSDVRYMGAVPHLTGGSLRQRLED